MLAACPAAFAAATAAGRLTSRAAALPTKRRRMASATPSSPRAKARVRAMASRGRLSSGASASNSPSTRSTQSAAHTATIRRSASLSVCREPTTTLSQALACSVLRPSLLHKRLHPRLDEPAKCGGRRRQSGGERVSEAPELLHRTRERALDAASRDNPPGAEGVASRVWRSHASAGEERTTKPSCRQRNGQWCARSGGQVDATTGLEWAA